MRKILQFIKNNAIGFIVGLIIAGGVGVYAVAVASSEVTYDNTESGSAATTVKEAIDELYSIASSSGDGCAYEGRFKDQIYDMTFVRKCLNAGYHFYVKNESNSSMSLYFLSQTNTWYGFYSVVTGVTSTDWVDWTSNIITALNGTTIPDTGKKYIDFMSTAQSGNQHAARLKIENPDGGSGQVVTSESEIVLQRLTTSTSTVDCGFTPRVIVLTRGMNSNYPELIIVDFEHQKAAGVFHNNSNKNGGMNYDDTPYGYNYLAPGYTLTETGFTTTTPIDGGTTYGAYVWCIR